MINTLFILLLTAQLPFVDWYNDAATSGNGLGNGLTAYYRFDETSGSAIDSGPSLLHIPAVGSPSSSASGIINNARTINTSGAYGFIRTSSFAYYTTATGFTVAFWVKFSAPIPDTKPYHVLMGKGNGATTKWSWEFGVWRAGGDTTTQFEFGLTDINGLQTSATLPQVPINNMAINTWYCLMARYYPDGTSSLAIRPQGPSSWQTDPDPTVIKPTFNDGAPLSIGGWASTLTTIDSAQPSPTGTMFDEMGFWNRALTDCERDQFFNLGQGRLFSTYDLLTCQ